DRQEQFDRLLLHRTTFLFISMWKRYFHLLSSCTYDRVIVRRSILLYNEYGNLFYEKLLLSIHPFALLDFDDNMERKDAHTPVSWYGRLTLEKKDKFIRCLQLYRKFIAGSPVLKQMVLDVNKHVK